MLSLDDHAGNVVTTVAVFTLAAAVFYVARSAFLVLLLSLLFAYLLEPAVSFLELHSRLGQKHRSWAIAEVYLIGAVLLGSLGYEFGPHLVTQIKALNAAVPRILEDLSSGKAAAALGGTHGLSAAQQLRMQDLLARNHDFLVRIFERGAGSAAYVAGSSIWLFAIPILAIFILRDRRQMADELFEAVQPPRRPKQG